MQIDEFVWRKHALEPLNVVAAIYEQKCFIITAYRPSLEEFESDYRTMKHSSKILL